MPTGKIKTLFSDKEKTEALFPRTKTKAVSDDNGVGLDAILEHVVYSVPDAIADSSNIINADTLQGYEASDFATPNFVVAKIAEAQLGGDNSDIDLSGYATKDELNKLTAEDVGARPADWMPNAADVGAAPAELVELAKAFGIGVASILPAPNDNFDTLSLNGIYLGLHGRIIGFPTDHMGEWCFVLNLVYDADLKYGAQFGMAMNENVIVYRYKRNGEWSEWKKPNAEAFAPAGYGLGEEVGKYCADCNTTTKSGFYYVNFNTSNIPAGVGGTLLVQSVVATYGIDIYQTIKNGACVLQRYYSSYSGAWQPWEFVNPPMENGVEYRTTERWNGKPVYTYALSLETLPNTSNKDVSHGIANIDKVISCTGTTSDGRTLPFYGPYTKIHLSAIKTAVCVCTETDESSMTGTATIKYTKTTD